MTGSIKQIYPLLGAGLLLGVVANLLLRTVPWGINVTIWVAAFYLVILMLVRRFGLAASANVTRLMPLALFFAFTFAWRDSDTLKLINGAALCVVLALAALRNRRGTLAKGWVNEYSFGLVAEWLMAPISYLREVSWMCRWGLKGAGTLSATSLAVLRGLAIALPLLFVFGRLFMKADPYFEQFAMAVLDFDFATFLNWLIWLPFCTVIAGGILVRMVQDHEPVGFAPERGSFRLGGVETTIVLGLLNLLFFSFIASQARYFFGGSAVLADAPGLTVAVYARRGFFELVTVTALVLPLLLVIDWLQEGPSPKGSKLYPSLSGALVLMLFAIMASAMHRMYLYQQTFGLTELRLYTTMFMVWLALVFLWFLRTVLFAARCRFAFGAIVTAFAVIAVLDLMNPDHVIVSVNAERAVTGRTLDCAYLYSLSDDALPALVKALPLVQPHVRTLYAQQFLTRLQKRAQPDWRCWNWSMETAEQVLREHQAELQRLAMR